MNLAFATDEVEEARSDDDNYSMVGDDKMLEPRT